MAKKKEKQQINVDGTDYFLDDISDDAKTQILNIQFVDERIEQLNNEWAVADTARIGYTNALKHEFKDVDKK